MSEGERRHRDYRERLTAVLGYPRCRLMACLGGDVPLHAPVFDPPPGADVRAAFHEFVASRLADAPKALAGAARLYTGDLSGADEILDHLPVQRGLRGWCNTLPYQALTVALPLPTTLGEPSTWLAGSPEQAALRQWLEQHRRALRWDEVEGNYRWSEPPESEPAGA